MKNQINKLLISLTQSDFILSEIIQAKQDIKQSIEDE